MTMSEATMAKAINGERRRFDGKRTLSVKDESEFRKGDVAARWIARAESQIAARKQRAAELPSFGAMAERDSDKRGARSS
jgi:hypothetical protein